MWWLIKMKKLYIFVFLTFFLSLLSNETKAQTLTGDVVVCTLQDGSTTIVKQDQFIAGALRNTSIYRQCDTKGSSVTTSLTIHRIGLCTSAPTINFVNAAAKTADLRAASGGTDEAVAVGESDLSACQNIMNSTTGTRVTLSNAGDKFPLVVDKYPTVGTYTHGIFVIDETVTISAVVNFTASVSDGTNSATRCVTNGSTIIDTGGQGPIVNGTPRANGGATCSSSTAATANTMQILYSNIDGIGNSTRGVESTSLGEVNFYNVNDNLQRSQIITTSNGTTTATTKILMVVTFTTPVTITKNFESLQVLQNLSRTVSLDFEQNGAPEASTTIRLIQQGPFGIAFRAINAKKPKLK